MLMENKTAEQWEQLGSREMEQGDFLEATNCFNLGLVQNPDDCRILYKLGKVYLSRGALEDALRCFDKLLNLNPDDASAMAAKGAVLKYLGREAEGKVLCQQALQFNPEAEEVLCLVGETFLNDDDLLGKKLIERLLVKNPQHAEALYLMGLWYWFQQQPSVAKKYFSEAVTNNPHLINRLYAQVRFLNQTAAVNNLGLDFLDQCLDFDRAHSRFYKTRAELLLERGRTTDAFQAFQEAENLDPNDFEVQYNLGCIYFMMGNSQAGVNAFNRTIELNPRHSQALTNLAAIHCDVFSDYPQALELVNKALEYDPKLVTAWTNKGIILSHLGDIVEAIAAFDQALAIDPNNTEAMLQKGGMLNDRCGLHDEAIKLFNKASQLSPENPICWWDLSQAFIGKNDYEEALQCIDKVIELNPLYPGAMRNRVVLLKRLGRDQEAQQFTKNMPWINSPGPGVNRVPRAIPQGRNTGIFDRLTHLLRKKNPK